MAAFCFLPVLRFLCCLLFKMPSARSVFAKRRRCGAPLLATWLRRALKLALKLSAEKGAQETLNLSAG
jgi:hypothetical protein